MIWFLTGFIVGFLSLMLILVSYDEYLVLKIERDEEYFKKRKRKVKTIKIP